MSRIVAFFIFLSLAFMAKAEILKTYSVNSPTVKKLHDFVDEETMVFITLDDVAMIPDYMFYSNKGNPYRTYISDLRTRAKRTGPGRHLLEQWYRSRKMKLLEPEWKELIALFKEKGAKVYGVQHYSMPMKDIEKKLFLETQQVELGLDQYIGKNNVIVLGGNEDWLSVFYQGILFTGPTSPAQTINNFMKKTGIVPKKTLYFGARENLVKQVDKILRPYRMKFYSVIYMGSSEYKPDIDIGAVKYQLEYFNNTGIMLDDDAVKKRMGKDDKKATN